MIITKTPFRISFVGGGSDLKDFYEQSQGAVLSTSINKFMYIASHNFFDSEKIRIKYSQTETVQDINKIQHPIVYQVLKKFKINGALEISSNADIPAKSGLGSSSAFTVGLLHNLYSRSGKYISKDLLAEEACDIEINKLNEPIGKQDQYAAAFGGLNIFRFNPEGTVEIEKIHLKKEIYKALQQSLLIFYIGNSRKASSILSEQKINMQDENRSRKLQNMVTLVWELRDSLYQNRLEDFGRILHENWLLKKDLASKITNKEIDDLYKIGMQQGALGGKLLGAGGGGFMLFCCPDTYSQERLRKTFRNLRELKFKFENEGSKLIYAGNEYDEC